MLRCHHDVSIQRFCHQTLQVDSISFSTRRFNAQGLVRRLRGSTCQRLGSKRARPSGTGVTCTVELSCLASRLNLPTLHLDPPCGFTGAGGMLPGVDGWKLSEEPRPERCPKNLK